MSKKARRNYIRATSQLVNRKKMYKAKKQWIVAGMSFLVAIGIGASVQSVGVHADATNTHAQTTAMAKPSTSMIQNQASQLHNKILGNQPIHNNQAQSNVANPVKQSASATSVSSVSASSVQPKGLVKLANNKPNSISASSSINNQTSSVASSNNVKPISSVSNSIKPVSNSITPKSTVNSTVSSASSTSQQKQSSSAVVPKSTSSVANQIQSQSGSMKQNQPASIKSTNLSKTSAKPLIKVGTSHHLLGDSDSDNSNNLSGTIPAMSSDSDASDANNAQYKWSDASKTLTIHDGNMSDSSALRDFEDQGIMDSSGNSLNSDATTINFSNVNVNKMHSANGLFKHDTYLKNINGLNTLNMHNVTSVSDMFQSDKQLNPNILSEIKSWRFNKQPNGILTMFKNSNLSSPAFYRETDGTYGFDKEAGATPVNIHIQHVYWGNLPVTIDGTNDTILVSPTKSDNTINSNDYIAENPNTTTASTDSSDSINLPNSKNDWVVKFANGIKLPSDSSQILKGVTNLPNDNQISYIDLSNLDTSDVTNISDLFGSNTRESMFINSPNSDYNYINNKTLSTMGDWNVKKVTHLTDIFSNSKHITNWDAIRNNWKFNQKPFMGDVESDEYIGAPFQDESNMPSLDKNGVPYIYSDGHGGYQFTIPADKATSTQVSFINMFDGSTVNTSTVQGEANQKTKLRAPNGYNFVNNQPNTIVANGKPQSINVLPTYMHIYKWGSSDGPTVFTNNNNNTAYVENGTLPNNPSGSLMYYSDGSYHPIGNAFTSDNNWTIVLKNVSATSDMSNEFGSYYSGNSNFNSHVSNIIGLSDLKDTNKITSMWRMFRSDTNLNPNVVRELRPWRFNTQPNTKAMVYNTQLNNGTYIGTVSDGHGKYMFGAPINTNAKSISASDIYGTSDGMSADVPDTSDLGNWAYVNANGIESKTPIKNKNGKVMVAPAYKGMTYHYNKSNKSLEFTNGTLQNGSDFISNSNTPDFIKNATSIKFDSDMNTAPNCSMWGMFMSDGDLQSVDMELDTHTANNMANMFSNDSALNTITLGEKFNTSDVTNMASMFQSDNQLASDDLSQCDFDTSKVTTMSDMFNNDISLKSLDLGANFNTSNVSDMSDMFANDNQLFSLDLPNLFNTNKVTDMKNMFSSDSDLKDLEIDSSDAKLNKSAKVPQLYQTTGDSSDGGSLYTLSAPHNFAKGNSGVFVATRDPDPNISSKYFDGMTWKFDKSTGTLEFTGGSMDWIPQHTADINKIPIPFVGVYSDTAQNSNDSDIDVAPKGVNPRDIKTIKFDESVDTSNMPSDVSDMFGLSTLQNIEGMSDWNMNGVNNLSDMFRDDVSLNSNVFYEMKNWRFNSKPNVSGMLWETNLNDGRDPKVIPDNHGKYMFKELNPHDNVTAQVNSDIYASVDGSGKNIPATNNLGSDWAYVDKNGIKTNTPVKDSKGHVLIAPQHDGLIYKYTKADSIAEFTNGKLTWNGGNNTQSLDAYIPFIGQYINRHNWERYTNTNGLGYAKHIIFDSDIDTSNLTNMSDMFVGDTPLQTIDFGNGFNTSKVTNMSDMLDTDDQTDNTGSNLQIVSFGKKFDTSNVKKMSDVVGSDSPLNEVVISSPKTKFSSSSATMYYPSALSDSFSRYQLSNDIYLAIHGMYFDTTKDDVAPDNITLGQLMKIDKNYPTDYINYLTSSDDTELQPYANETIGQIRHKHMSKSGITMPLYKVLGQNVNGRPYTFVRPNDFSKGNVGVYVHYNPRLFTMIRHALQPISNIIIFTGVGSKTIQEPQGTPMSISDGSSLIPKGYKLQSDKPYKFTFNHNNDFHIIPVVKAPVSDTDRIVFKDASDNSDTIDTNDNKPYLVVKGNNGASYTVNSSQVPKGYHLTKDSNSTFTFNGGIHTVDIAHDSNAGGTVASNLVPCKDVIKFIDSDGSVVGQYKPNNMISDNTHPTITFTSGEINNNIPSDYQIVNTKHIKLHNRKHYVLVTGRQINLTVYTYGIVSDGNGNAVVKTRPLPYYTTVKYGDKVSGIANSSDTYNPVIDPSSYDHDLIYDNNTPVVITKDNIKQYMQTGINYVYTATEASPLQINYTQAGNNNDVISSYTVSTSDLGKALKASGQHATPLVGESVNLENIVKSNAPEGYKLQAGYSDYNYVLTNNGKKPVKLFMTMMPMATHHVASSVNNESAIKSTDSSITSSYAKSADASIASSMKNSVADSVNTSNQAMAKSLASSADKSIAISYANSTKASVASLNSSIAQSTDNSIHNSEAKSVADSVSASNKSLASSYTNSADKSIMSNNESMAKSEQESANTSIANSEKASVANSVKAIDNSLANSGAKATNASIANSYKNSINNSVEAKDNSLAQSIATSADNNIKASLANSVKNSVANLDSSIASSYANSADDSITSSERTSVAKSIKAMSKSMATSSANTSKASSNVAKPIVHKHHNHKVIKPMSVNISHKHHDNKVDELIKKLEAKPTIVTDGNNRSSFKPVQFIAKPHKQIKHVAKLNDIKVGSYGIYHGMLIKHVHMNKHYNLKHFIHVYKDMKLAKGKHAVLLKHHKIHVLHAYLIRGKHHNYMRLQIKIGKHVYFISGYALKHNK